MSTAKAASLLAAARQLLQNEDPKAALEARKQAEEALKRFQDSKDRDGALEAMLQVVAADLAQAQPLEAARMAKDKLAAFQLSGDKRGEAAMLLALSLAELAAREPGRALDSARKSAALCQRLGDVRREFQVHQQALVSIYLMIGEKKEALNAANQALALSKRVPDESVKADAYYAVLQARLANESRDTLAAAKEALALYEGIGDKKGEASTLNAIAQVHLSKKDAASAEQPSKEALELFRTLGHTKGTIEALSLLVKAQIQTGQLQQALQTVEEQMKMFIANQDKQGEASASLTLFLAHRSQEDQERHANEALELASQSLELFRDLGDRKGEADMWLKVAETHLAWGMVEEALGEAQEALMAYRDLRDKQGQDSANIIITEVYIRRDEPALAPLHSEGLQLLANVANAIDKRDGPAYQAANERLMTIGGYGLITDTEQASILGPVISADPDAAIEFMNSNSLDDAESGTAGKLTAPVGMTSQMKNITYLGFRAGGIGYGPRFRCVDYGSRMKTAAGEEKETLGFSVLQLQDQSDDWEYGLKLHPALLDCALQSAFVLGELAAPRKTDKEKR